jgi:hypothetical protein
MTKSNNNQKIFQKKDREILQQKKDTKKESEKKKKRKLKEGTNSQGKRMNFGVKKVKESKKLFFFPWSKVFYQINEFKI